MMLVEAVKYVCEIKKVSVRIFNKVGVFSVVSFFVKIGI